MESSTVKGCVCVSACTPCHKNRLGLRLDKNNGFDNLLLDLEELPHVLAFDVHVVNFVRHMIISSAPVQRIGFWVF